MFAAAGGAPADQDWYHNLLADPRVTVGAGTEVFAATAAVTTGEERDALFDRFAAVIRLKSAERTAVIIV